MVRLEKNTPQSHENQKLDDINYHKKHSIGTNLRAADWQPIDPLPFFKEGVQGAFTSESGPYQGPTI